MIREEFGTSHWKADAWHDTCQLLALHAGVPVT